MATRTIRRRSSRRKPGLAGRCDAGDTKETARIRDAMIATLNDESKSIEERGGAAIGLYAVADRDDVRKGLEGFVRGRRQGAHQGARSHVALAVATLREVSSRST